MTPWFLILGLTFCLFCFVLVVMGIRLVSSFARSKLEALGEEQGLQVRTTRIISQYEIVQGGLEIIQVLIFPVTWASLTLTRQYWINRELPDLSSNHVGVQWGDGNLELLLLVCLYVILRGASNVLGEGLLIRIWPVLECVSWISLPFLVFADGMTAMFRQVLGIPAETQTEAESLAEEIRSVTEEGHREGAIEDEARTMIHRVIDFEEIDVADIMTPRTEMVCIPASASLLDARQVLLEEGHSRIPVIGETNDEILGILHAKDLLRYLDGSTGQVVKLADIAREPFYIPKTMGVQKLLESFRQERIHLAIVLDEYGGVAGLVTMEDILEELVGEIVDEFDSASEAEPIRTVSEGVTDVSAMVHLDDLTSRLGIELPTDGQVDTLGGFVFSYLGRIPVTGEQFQIGNIQFTVLEAMKRRVVRLRLTIIDPVTEVEES